MALEADLSQNRPSHFSPCSPTCTDHHGSLSNPSSQVHRNTEKEPSRGQQHFNAQNRGTGLGQPKKRLQENAERQSSGALSDRATPDLEQQGPVLVFQEALRRRGARLANEVKIYIKDSCKPEPSLGQLNFSQCLAALYNLHRTRWSPPVRLKDLVQDVPLVCQESSTIECLEQLTVTDATDVNEFFLSQLAQP